jgi:hypothetical protein
MSFNIPTFSIPGMMPTTHPVTDSIYWSNPDGTVDIIFSDTDNPPTSLSFRILNYFGNILFDDPAGESYSRSGTSNKFSFGGPVQGYLPVGTYYLWVRSDGLVRKLVLINADNAFNLGQNTFTENTEVVDVPETTTSMPGTYNWPEVTTGDTFGGISSLQIVVNNASPAFPLTSARIHFRRIKGSTGTPELALSTTGGGIVIQNADTWIINIPELVVELPAATYYYDLETTDSQGAVKTYVSGSWKIKPDNTH